MRPALAAVFPVASPSHRSIRFRGWKRILLLLVLLLVALAGIARLAIGVVQAPSRALQAAMAAEVESGRYAPDVVRFYTVRGYQPLWVRPAGRSPFSKPVLAPEAAQAASLAGRVDPAVAAAARKAIEAAEVRSPETLARAELAASLALGAYVRSLAPAGPEPLAFIDPELARPRDVGAVLDQAAGARSVAAYVSGVAEVNPVYRDLRAGLERYRRVWSRLPQIQIASGPALRIGDQGARVDALRVRLGMSPGGGFDAPVAEELKTFQAAHGLAATGVLDASTLQALNRGSAHYEQLILDNLERARTLPPVFARRFVLVNVAARELQVYEDGQPRHRMRVIVGTREDPTPSMVGLIRYLIFNPYWNIPVDIVRTSVAPAVLRQGPGYLKASRYQVLSDWSESPVELDPRTVDWEAVSKGWQELRVRQLPRGDNMMGRIKFASPNELGIYLHDTPNKQHFNEEQRLLSAGCVRLEMAETLARWLMGGQLPDPGALKDDQEAYLDEPTPLYIAYLTAAPGPSGVTFHPDVYGRDKQSAGRAGS